MTTRLETDTEYRARALSDERIAATCADDGGQLAHEIEFHFGRALEMFLEPMIGPRRTVEEPGPWFCNACDGQGGDVRGPCGCCGGAGAGCDCKPEPEEIDDESRPNCGFEPGDGCRACTPIEVRTPKGSELPRVVEPATAEQLESLRGAVEWWLRTTNEHVRVRVEPDGVFNGAAYARLWADLGPYRVTHSCPIDAEPSDVGPIVESALAAKTYEAWRPEGKR